MMTKIAHEDVGADMAQKVAELQGNQPLFVFYNFHESALAYTGSTHQLRPRFHGSAAILA